MKSHEPDLRSEVKSDAQITVIQDDYRKAALDGPAVAMLDFAVQLTLRPREMTRNNIAALRHSGFSDDAILDIVQTTGYFNYANRVMDALGIELEPEMR